MKAKIPYGSRMSKKEEKELLAEIRKRVVIEQEAFDVGECATTLFAVMNFFGCGKDRLQAFFKEFYNLHKEFKERYEMDTEDYIWFCEKRLNDKGVPVREWFENALKNEEM